MNIVKEAIKIVRYQLAFSVVLGVITGLLNSAIVMFINRESASWNGYGQFFFYTLFVIAGLGCTLLSKGMLAYLSQNVIYHLRALLCKKILASPLKNIEKIGKPRLYAALTQDIDMLTGAMLYLPQVLISLVIVVTCAVMIGLLSIKAVLLLMGVILASLVVMYATDQLFVREKFSEARDASDDFFQAYEGLLDGFKELKLNSRYRNRFIIDSLLKAANSSRSNTAQACSLYAGVQAIWDGMLYVLIGVVLYSTYMQGSAMGHQIPAKIVVILLFVLGPLKTISLALPPCRQAWVSIKKILSLDFGLPDADLQFDRHFEMSVKEAPKIYFRNVSYTYSENAKGASFTLGPVNIDFSPGEIVVLAGHNGSGKSTLAKLIAGLYEPDDGEIYLGDKKINFDNKDWYRSHFAAIFTDYYIFDGLITEAYKKDPSIIQSCIDKMGLTDLFSFEATLIQPHKLSDGQRKRLGLLSTYAEDKSIYVFDEWAANQDPSFRQYFYEEMLFDLKRQKKIVIVVSHDDHYYSVADRLIFLEHGKIVDKANAPGMMPVLNEI